MCGQGVYDHILESSPATSYPIQFNPMLGNMKKRGSNLNENNKLV